MAYFIATLSSDRVENWEICVREGLWGVVGRGTNWRRNAEYLSAGDTVFIWRSGSPNGFIARVEALGEAEFVELGSFVPWPDRERFGATFPIRVVEQLTQPEGDKFLDSNGRFGSRFGFNNTVLQHIFERVSPAIGARILEVFPGATRREFGRPFDSPPPPLPTTAREPFDVDPDAVDRGLLAHYETVRRLAVWLSTHGFEPLLPQMDEPQFDLAWWNGEVLNVAEVKSLTIGNEESQLRLGLGQVLRYRQALRLHSLQVDAWLVAERAPSDASWARVCDEVDVVLHVPTLKIRSG